MPSLLERRASLFSPISLTSFQNTQDQLLYQWRTGLGDSCALAGMVIAPLLGKYVRGRLFSVLEPGMRSPSLWRNSSLQFLSRGFGLGAEVLSFEGVQRCLKVKIAGQSPSLLSWEGEEGLRQGLLHSWVSFMLLKSSHQIFPASNLIAQHFLTDAATVAGNHLAAEMGILPRSTQGIFQDLLQAEVMNWQMKAGLALFHQSSRGKWMQRERRMDLEMQLSLRTTFALRHGFSTQPHTLNKVEENPPSKKIPVGRHPFQVQSWEQLGSENSAELLLEKLRKEAAQMTADETELQVFYYGNLPKEMKLKKVQVEVLFQEFPHLIELKVGDLAGKTHCWFRDETKVEFVDDMGPLLDAEMESVRRIHLRGLWSPRYTKEKRLGPVLRQIRNEQGLSLGEVSERLREDYGMEYAERSLKTYENYSRREITRELLFALAEIYRQDVRDLIALANRTQFPKAPREIWMGEDYPIMIENLRDLEMIQFYAEDALFRSKIGWKIYWLRKNPFHYLPARELAEIVGVNEAFFYHLERNRHQPVFSILEALAQVFDIPQSEMWDASNATFFRDLYEQGLIRKSVYLVRQSEDRQKLLYYGENPGTFGEVLFYYRKGRPDHPSAKELSRRLNREENFWNRLEWNKKGKASDEKAVWVWLVEELNIALEDLPESVRAWLNREDSAVRLLQSALEGETIQAVVGREPSVSAETFYHILSGRRKNVLPETILAIQEALPALEGGKFYRALHPEMRNLFPEIQTAEPHLQLSEAEIREAMTFDLRLALFRYRMERMLSRADVARQWGMAQSTIASYEYFGVRIEDPDLLLKIADSLGLSRRMLYLHYHPEILRLFPVPGEGGKLRILSRAEYEQYRLLSEKAGDPGHLAMEVRRAMEKRGLEVSAENLASLLGLGLAAADDLLHVNRFHSDDKLQRLSAAFPEIPLGKWIEAYHWAEFVYFLGRKEDGSIDYRFPRGQSWEEWNQVDLIGEIRSSLIQRHGSVRKAADAMTSSFYRQRSHMERVRAEGSLMDFSMVRLARELDLDERGVYFYFRTRLLQQISR